jgi:hypothetical protein
MLMPTRLRTGANGVCRHPWQGLKFTYAHRLTCMHIYRSERINSPSATTYVRLGDLLSMVSSARISGLVVPGWPNISDGRVSLPQISMRPEPSRSRCILRARIAWILTSQPAEANVQSTTSTMARDQFERPMYPPSPRVRSRSRRNLPMLRFAHHCPSPSHHRGTVTKLSPWSRQRIPIAAIAPAE